MLANPDVLFLNQLAALSEDLILKEHAAAAKIQEERNVSDNERYPDCSERILNILKDFISTAYPAHAVYDQSRDTGRYNDGLPWRSGRACHRRIRCPLQHITRSVYLYQRTYDPGLPDDPENKKRDGRKNLLS